MKGIFKVEEQKEEIKPEVNMEAKEKNKKQKKPKNKKVVIIPIIVIAVVCFIFSIIFAIITSFNEEIIKGVSISGIDVSGYSKEEIKNKFDGLVEENKTKSIVLKYQDVEKTITPEELGLTCDVEDVASEAYLVGRNGNIFVNNFEIVQSFFSKRNIDMKYTINEEKLQEIIKEFNETLPDGVKQYEYCIEDDELIITKGTEGIAVTEPETENKIKEALVDFSTKNNVIEAPVENVKPDDIDLEKIHTEIYKEPQDAYITQDPVTVHPNINGVDFAITMDEAKELLKEDKEEYTIPLKITIAEKTLSDLGAEAFPNELGSYSTKFNVSNSNRNNNIKLATNKINGTIILPGETFSYNQTVGKRTIQAGFKEAGAYAGGQVVQEVGGGICQVSSTLYNAVLYANLEIVERSNHHFETSYVAASRDATVSWGTLDFKFKNNRKYPIKVVATCNNGVVSVGIYGIKEEVEYEVIIQSKKLSTVYRETKYENDNSIESGKEVVVQNGHEGCISEAYKIVRLNGETISSTLLSRDKYYALDRIIKIGTKEVVKEEPKDEVVADPENKTDDNSENTETKQDEEPTNTEDGNV
jgi:vancomycin resistance protein YoaR